MLYTSPPCPPLLAPVLTHLHCLLSVLSCSAALLSVQSSAQPCGCGLSPAVNGRVAPAPSATAPPQPGGQVLLHCTLQRSPAVVQERPREHHCLDIVGLQRPGLGEGVKPLDRLASGGVDQGLPCLRPGHRRASQVAPPEPLLLQLLYELHGWGGCSVAARVAAVVAAVAATVGVHPRRLSWGQCRTLLCSPHRPATPGCSGSRWCSTQLQAPPPSA